MNTTNTNTVFDTPSYSQASQFESTGIRELTLEEIELVNGACSASEGLLYFAAGVATGGVLFKHAIAALVVGVGFAGVYYYEECLSESEKEALKAAAANFATYAI